MEKKITAKQHGDALIKLMQVTNNATNKYLTIENDDNISQQKKNAIAKQVIKAIRKQTEIFDAIDEAYNVQSERW